MSNIPSAYDESQGRPNLGVLQYIQDNWGADEISASLRVEKVSITASGTAGVTTTDIPVGAEIVDVVVHANATSGSGTARLSVGGGGANITDAIVMATADAITRAGSIDQTYKNVVTAGVTVTTHADADLGDVYIHYKK